MTEAIDSFFSGGGGKSLSWKDVPIGTTYTGTILAVNAPQQVTDPVTSKPVFQRDGVTPKMQARIDLATTYRDPADAEDDGSRSLYVGGWMKGAIGDAVRKATGKPGAPAVGGVLTVTLTEREPNENRALNPTNKFVAVYQPPAAAAAGQFYGQGQPAPAPQPQYAPTPQPQYAPPAAAAPVAAPVPAAVHTPPPQAAPAPAKPAAISDAAWAAMDPATRATVAATMGSATDAPPY